MDLNKCLEALRHPAIDPSTARRTRVPDGDPWWYYEIRGKRGWVYPYSETQIAVVLPTRAARRLMKLMGSELVLLQHADDRDVLQGGRQTYGRPRSLHQAQTPAATDSRTEGSAGCPAGRQPLPETQTRAHKSWLRSRTGRCFAGGTLMTCRRFPTTDFFQTQPNNLGVGWQRRASARHPCPTRCLSCQPTPTPKPRFRQFGGLYDEKTVGPKPAYPAQC